MNGRLVSNEFHNNWDFYARIIILGKLKAGLEQSWPSQSRIITKVLTWLKKLKLFPFQPFESWNQIFSFYSLFHIKARKYVKSLYEAQVVCSFNKSRYWTSYHFFSNIKRHSRILEKFHWNSMPETKTLIKLWRFQKSTQSSSKLLKRQIKKPNRFPFNSLNWKRKEKISILSAAAINNVICLRFISTLMVRFSFVHEFLIVGERKTLSGIAKLAFELFSVTYFHENTAKYWEFQIFIYCATNFPVCISIRGAFPVHIAENRNDEFNTLESNIYLRDVT